MEEQQKALEKENLFSGYATKLFRARQQQRRGSRKQWEEYHRKRIDFGRAHIACSFSRALHQKRVFFRNVRCGADIRYRVALSLRHEASSVSMARRLDEQVCAERNMVVLKDGTRLSMGGLGTVCLLLRCV